MGTIFVAYGDPDHRDQVLEFAAEQAAPCGHDLFVYHVQESAGETVGEVKAEARRVMEDAAPEVPYEIHVDAKAEFSERTNVSKQKRLTDAILDGDREYEYVVMGDVDRSSIEELTHASTTRAVLETHQVPVTLVPV